MLSFSFIIATLVLVFAGAYNTYLRLTSPPEVPPGIPWIGVGKGVFAKWRARVKAFGGYIGLIEDGYRKVSPSLLSIGWVRLMGGGGNSIPRKDFPLFYPISHTREFWFLGRR